MPTLSNKPTAPKFAYNSTVWFVLNNLIVSAVVKKIIQNVINPANDSDGVQTNLYYLEGYNDHFLESDLYKSYQAAMFHKSGGEYLADLSGINFGSADLGSATLAYCDLNNANLSDAEIAGLDLSGAKLTDAQLPAAVEDKEDLKDLLGEGNYNDDTIYTDGTGINDVAP